MRESDILELIQEATDSEVRTVLAALCAESDDTARKASKLLGRLMDAAQAYEKRKLPPPSPLHICLNCQKPFAESDHTAQACQYHTGVIVVDDGSEVWEDCDDHQIDNSEAMREDFPEGFAWSCCWKAMDEPGCARGAHRMGGAKKAVAPVESGGETSKKRARTE